MLACARLGAIHSVVFGGFAPRELAKRIDDAEPVAVLATSCGIEPKGVLDYKPLLDEAFQHAKKPPRSLLLLRRTAIKGHTSPAVNAKAAVAEFDWQAECDRLPHDKRVIDCEPVKSSDPLCPSALYRCTSLTRFRHAIHLGHDGQSEGRRANERGQCSPIALRHGEHDGLYAGVDLLLRVRRGVGRRSRLHCVGAAAARLRIRALRGQAECVQATGDTR